MNDIKKSEDKIFEQYEFNKFVIKQTHKRGDFVDVLKLFQNLMKQFNQILLKSKMFVKMKDELIALYY